MILDLLVIIFLCVWILNIIYLLYYIIVKKMDKKKKRILEDNKAILEDKINLTDLYERVYKDNLSKRLDIDLGLLTLKHYIDYLNKCLVSK